jgi:L,D-peptidoglycan transpeptidase YkuD (ErfK/YbiS/YcfS/YnhG family)
MDVTVVPNGSEALLDWGSGAHRAAIGRSGIATKQKEGDGITPLGSFAIRHVLYRADRLAAPQTTLPLSEIAPDDGWCDAPNDALYNRPVKRPYRASSETLWREDRLYDLIVVLGFNDTPVVAGKGSAIFLHVARLDFAPTQGCIALAKENLVELLALLRTGDRLTVRS